MVTTLLIVRHAQTTGNLDRIFQGRIDRPVSEAGEVQLSLLAERFKDVKTDVVCSSPLPRAVKTAEAITRFNEVPIELYDGLMEINAGDFEGKHWDELPILYPKEFENWRSDWNNFTAPNGESCKEVYDRVSSTVLDIVSRHKGKTVAVVSHGCAVKNLLCFAAGLKLSDDIMSIPIVQNTSVSRVDIDESGVWKLIYSDDAHHLDGAELPTPVLWK